MLPNFAQRQVHFVSFFSTITTPFTTPLMFSICWDRRTSPDAACPARLCHTLPSMLSAVIAVLASIRVPIPLDICTCSWSTHSSCSSCCCKQRSWRWLKCNSILWGICLRCGMLEDSSWLWGRCKGGKHGVQGGLKYLRLGNRDSS